MNTLDFARWQFAITTLFHFIFVPISIGLALFVAICQTRWYLSNDEVWLRATRFWGKFMLVSMAIGVVTGLVMEFQFGMNWSIYSRYVGDVFGPPLAMEGLIAFFAESTFVGIWIFGWGRLSKKIHLWTIWLVAIGTMLSAYFIIAANSWMQHPVGYAINHATGKAYLTNIFSVLFNPILLLGFPHTVLGAITTGGMLVIAICAFLWLRGNRNAVIGRSMRMALPFTLIAVLVTMMLGDGQGRVLIHQEPMKMAAAEAVCTSSRGAGFSILSFGTFTDNPCPKNVTSVRIPHLLSLIEDLSWDSNITGIETIQKQEAKKYGPGNYVPIVGVEYWTFRLMIGGGILMFLIAAGGMLLDRRKRLETHRNFHRLALLGVVLPILSNWCGWIFTEVGRQPWVVFGLLKTSAANSPDVNTGQIALTLTGYVVIYGVLIVIGAWVMLKEAKHGPEPDPPPGQTGDPTPPDSSANLILAY